MILCISNVIGTMTPPVAVNIFSAVQVTRSVRELKIGEISKAEIPFFIGYVAVFFLCVQSSDFFYLLSVVILLRSPLAVVVGRIRTRLSEIRPSLALANPSLVVSPNL